MGNNQFVKDKLQQYDQMNTYCDDGFYYITPRFYVNHAGADTYVGGNALFIYDAGANYSTEPILDISFCLFTLGVDGLIGVTTTEQNYPTVYYKSMGTGVAVILLQTSYQVHVTITNTVAYRNQASRGGNLNFQVNPLTFDINLSNVYSVKGISELGGSLYFTIISSLLSALNNNSDHLNVTNSTFSTDYITANGIFFLLSEWNFPMHFEQCNEFVNLVLLSALRLSVPTNEIIFSNTVFSAAGCSGGIGAYYTSIKVSNCSFSKYTNIYGSESYIYVANSMFANTMIPALMLENSYLSLTGNVSFINNVVQGDGGALYLSYSDLTLIAPANISFTNNSASIRGGAIFIRKSIKGGECNIIINDPNGSLECPGVHLSFQGNHATLAGDVLYGGDIDACTFDCKLTPNYCSSSGGYMLAVFNATTLCGNTKCGNTASNLTMISSDPRTICSCTNSTIDCRSKPSTKVMVYPGQTIDIPIVTVGQLNGISPDNVLSFTCDVSNGQSNINCTAPSFSGEQQQTMQYCSNYSYQVKGKDNQLHNSAIHLLSKAAYADGYGTSTYSMLVTVFPCPTASGFIWDQATKVCSCSPIRQKYNVPRDINTLTVLKTGTLWIGSSSSGELAVYTHCPYDYCKTNDTWRLMLTNQDEQCDYNHSGVLCGGCKENFSAVFGSPQCKLCTDKYWILVPIAVLGVVMVALLFLFNCTVTMGTINCLILYANVVGPSILYIIPHNYNYDGYFKKFLFVFIDWLNLDLGI